jgi:predicted Zn-dependent protease with MMP-like domain
MDDIRFAKIVEKAIEGLPDQFRDALENIDIDVEEWPDPALLKKLGFPRGRLLLGLYQGVPITRRRRSSMQTMPDRIVIYKGPIEAVSSTEEEIEKRIQITVLHEIGHYFGLDDRRLREHGYG